MIKFPFVTRRRFDNERDLRLDLERKVNQLERAAEAYRAGRDALKAKLNDPYVATFYGAMSDAGIAKMAATMREVFEAEGKTVIPMPLTTFRHHASAIRYGTTTADAPDIPTAKPADDVASAFSYHGMAYDAAGKPYESMSGLVSSFDSSKPAGVVRRGGVVSYPTATGEWLVGPSCKPPYDDFPSGMAFRPANEAECAKAMWEMDWSKVDPSADVETDGGGDIIAEQAARDAWQMQRMFGKEEEPGLESDPISEEEADQLRRNRDWTPPRANDEQIH